MNKYNVKSGKGTLIPDWIVEKMLDEQVKQGNPRNVKVFKDNPYSDRYNGGFLWALSVLGVKYWDDIITNGVYPPKPSTDVDELVEKVSNVIRDTLTNSFVLPERWCIKGTTHDECMAINAYARSLQGGDHWVDKHNNAKYYYLCIKDGKYLKGDYNINGTLITFEQFQKYVLKPSSPNFVKQHLVEKSPKYKVGDWVSFTSEVDKCIYTSKIKDWTSHSYCVLENKQEPFKHLLRKATSEEIKDAEKDALLAEAESKYPIGTVFKSAYSGFISKVTDKIRTAIDNDGLVDDEGMYILFKGKWAEIIKTPCIIINGYKVEFFPTYVKFGYAEINKEVFIDLATINEYSNTNREVESVTIGRGVFTKAQIKEIADYYNELQ